jgi:organic radical activating enzyme
MKKLNLVQSNETKTQEKFNETLFQKEYLSQSNQTIWKCLLGKESVEFINIENIKKIPQTFDKIPSGYINNVAHRWNYSEAEMNEALEDGSSKMLHLDVDFGKTCRLHCAHCFKNNKELQHAKKEELSFDELKEIILNFKELGLKTVKVCGAGEPFDNKDFITFLQFLSDNDIKASVFTKWYVIWDDKRIADLYSHIGITNWEQLAQKLKELDTSILLSFNSFDDQIQKEYSWATKWELKDKYISSRNQSLVNCINAWLNEFKPWEATRLAIVMAPMKPENLTEVKEIYIWGRMRNIYPVWCPANLAGQWNAENERVNIVAPDYQNNLVDVYSDLYVWNVQNGVISLEQLKKEWVSLYPGCHPCTQTRIWGYLNLYGELLSCPWHNTKREELKISKNIKEEPDYLKMRRGSLNYKREGYNQHCIARDEITLQIGFYDMIIKKINEKLNK